MVPQDHPQDVQGSRRIVELPTMLWLAVFVETFAFRKEHDLQFEYSDITNNRVLVFFDLSLPTHQFVYAACVARKLKGSS